MPARQSAAIDFDTRYDADARGGAIPVYRDIVLTGVTGVTGPWCCAAMMQAIRWR